MAVSVPLIMSRADCTSRSLYSSGIPMICAITIIGRRSAKAADEVRPAVLAEFVDQPVAVAVDIAPDTAVVDAPDGVGDRSAQPFVIGAVGEHADGLPGEDRSERMLLRHGAVVQGPPAPGVPGELRRSAGHMEVLAVPEHQPGGYIPLEQDRGHRAVFGAQLLVQTHRVVLRLGPVEPPQATGADGRRAEVEVAGATAAGSMPWAGQPGGGTAWESVLGRSDSGKGVVTVTPGSGRKKGEFMICARRATGACGEVAPSARGPGRVSRASKRASADSA